jgi:hypothetical protein
MKKPYCFPTWEEQKDVYISCDEKSILFINAVKTNIYALTQIIDDNEDSPIIAKKIARDGLETMAIDQSTPSDPILAKLCELTGAKMYGDYVVLDKLDLYSVYTLWNKYDKFTGDLIEMDSREYGCGCNQKFEHCKGCLQLCNKQFEKSWGETHSDYYTNEPFYNIFQEYSKFLRGEENKWEEVKKVLDL